VIVGQVDEIVRGELRIGLFFDLQGIEQQVEYLHKMEIVAQQITDRVFYKRVDQFRGSLT